MIAAGQKKSFLNPNNLSSEQIKSGLLKSLTAFLIVAAPLFYLADRYTINVDYQKITSLDYRVFLTDTHNTEITKDSIVVFNVDDPYGLFNKDVFAKIATGFEGDEVEVKDGVVSLNGNQVATLSDKTLVKLNKPVSHFNKKYTVGKNELFVLGTHNRSYDSRYWGVVKNSQILGRGYGIYDF